MERRVSKTETIYYQEEKGFLLFEKIEKKEYRLLKILKDSHRSYVALVEIESKNYIYKEPREKNTRKWQRFLSLFRGSESRREGLHMQEIEKNGFLGPKFCYSYEKKALAMVLRSYLVYEYIEGREPKQEEADAVLRCLQEIHRKGFLHGDSQVSNFLIKEDKLYLIDATFSKNRYGSLGRAYEMYYFALSCPGWNLDIHRGELSYEIAKFWKDIREFWVKRKTRRREKK